MASIKTTRLLQQTEALSAALQAETEAHARDLAALEGLQAKAAQEEGRMAEAQAALEQDRAELARQYARLNALKHQAVSKLKEIRQQQKAQLEAEAKDARLALQQELEAERARAQAELLHKVQAFSDNYGYYLSQLKLMMDLITKAATNTGKVFLTADAVDTEQMFRGEMAAGADEAFGPADRDEAEAGETLEPADGNDEKPSGSQ